METDDAFAADAKNACTAFATAGLQSLRLSNISRIHASSLEAISSTSDCDIVTKRFHLLTLEGNSLATSNSPSMPSFKLRKDTWRNDRKVANRGGLPKENLR